MDTLNALKIINTNNPIPMKQVLILLVGFILLSCQQNGKESTPSTTKESTLKTDNFDWLLGNWKRLGEEEGKETFENWKKISHTEYSGLGFTMQRGDTIKQEKIRLIKSDENWDVIVKVPEEAASVTFKGISHTENQFICENNEIDFPNKIKYWKQDDKIHASVSNAEMDILFEFERISL